MSDIVSLEQVRAVKARWEERLLRKKNVVGVGIGFKQEKGQITDKLALIISVRQREDPSQLAPEDLIPSEIEGVPTDVIEVGEIRAL